MILRSASAGRAELALWGATLAVALSFSVFFFAGVLPALLPSTDLVRIALLDGLVNPTARGYTIDTLATGLVLFAWIAYERRALGVRHGWVAVLVTFVPGVVVGLVAYLLIRRASVPNLPRVAASTAEHASGQPYSSS